MKKRLIAIPLALGVAGAAYAGTSHMAGTQTQEKYEQLLQKINGQQARFVLNNEEYTSGLLKSTAVTKVTIPQTDEDDIVFNLFHDIEHGALRSTDDDLKFASVSVNTTLQDNQVLPADVLAAMTDDIPFELKTDIGYDGDMHNHLRVSGVDAAENSSTMVWSGLTADAVTSGSTTTGDGSLGSLKVDEQSDGIVVTLDDSNFNFNVQDEGGSIYTGMGELAFSALQVQSPNLPTPVTVGSATVTSETSIEDDALNSNTVFAIEGIDAPIPVNTVSFEAQYYGLLVEGMREYSALMSTLSADDADAQIDEAFASEMLGAVRGILAPGAGTLNRLKLANSDGEVDVDLRIGLKAASEGGMSPDALNSIVTGRDLLNVLTVEANLDADRAAIKNTPLPMMLGSAGEFITVDENSITSTASLEGMNLNINGVLMPLDALTGGMLDVPLLDLM